MADHSRFRERYGPTAVVTGASAGIGRAVATELARRGLDLCLVARRGDVLEELAQRLRADHGVDVAVVPLDLGDPSAAATLLTRTTGLDVGLYVAAAGFGTTGGFLDADAGREVEMLRVNVESVLATTHGFATRMARRGSGGIVLLSSIVAFQGVPRSAGYAATKAYVQVLAEGLRPELASFGVDVLAVAPGPVHSEFADRAGMTMGRALTPEDVAGPALDALGRRGTVAPGALSKLLSVSLAPLPRRTRTTVMGAVMRGMTRTGGPH